MSPPAQAIFDGEQYISREKIACLLCRRTFPKLDTLEKHIKMSDLHKSNLEAKRKEFNLANPPPAAALHSESSSSSSSLHYRDRAKERRQMYGLDPTGLVEANETTTEISAEETARIKAITPLDQSNIGNKMLKSMGWSEGTGLGRHGQGIVNPIQAEQRAPGIGLGAANPRPPGGLYGPNRSFLLKQHTIQRWNDLPPDNS